MKVPFSIPPPAESLGAGAFWGFVFAARSSRRGLANITCRLSPGGSRDVPAAGRRFHGDPTACSLLESGAAPVPLPAGMRRLPIGERGEPRHVES